MADNMPDFDKMSPEELMLWMESLAKRQGANPAEMTTSADLQIAEVDPDTVILDEPGYVPSEGKSKGQAVLPPAKKQPAATPAPAPVPAPPAPAAPPEIQRPAAVVEPPVLEPLQLGDEDTEIAQPAATQNAMAWLESLAADQGGLPELDLSGLGAAIEPVAAEPAKSDPIAWLEGLTDSQGETAPVTASADTSDPFAGSVDPMNWLESLAKRQGVKGEELLTKADLSIPAPDNVLDSGPGYTDYSVDAPVAESSEAAQAAAEPTALTAAELESPADWLDSLASGQGFTPRQAETPAEEIIPSDDDMREALRSGKEIAPEDMEAWFNKQLDRGFEREEPELPAEEDEEIAEPDYDPEAPAIPAALPDWLSEMAPAAPEPPKEPIVEQQAFIEQIVEPPAVPDMPDWLKEEVGAHSDLDLDSIFASTEAVPEPPAPPVIVSPVPSPNIELEVDHSDPWVEAFDHEQGIITLSDVPQAATASATLEEAVLEPEEELAAGQPESMPDWLNESPAIEEEVIEPGEMPDWLSESAPAVEEATIEPGEMPDWLKEVGAEIEPHEIPDWLIETGDTEEQVVIPSPAPTPAVTTPVIVAPLTPKPAPAAISPAPVPLAVALSDSEAAAALSNARSQAESNVEVGLAEYERLVRANAQLDAVLSDLSLLVTKHEKNPAVYRVLGDSLMRNGQLQAALDTYRKALNLL